MKDTYFLSNYIMPMAPVIHELAPIGELYSWKDNVRVEKGHAYVIVDVRKMNPRYERRSENVTISELLQEIDIPWMKRKSNTIDKKKNNKQKRNSKKKKVTKFEKPKSTTD